MERRTSLATRRSRGLCCAPPPSQGHLTQGSQRGASSLSRMWETPQSQTLLSPGGRNQGGGSAEAPQGRCCVRIAQRGHPGGAPRFIATFSPGRDPGDRDGVPRQAPCMEPASPSACVSASLSVCLSRINKILKKKKELLSGVQAPEPCQATQSTRK